MRSMAAVVVTLLLGVSLVGCGGGDSGDSGDGGDAAPPLCVSVATLKTSVEKLKNIDVTSSGAVSDLESGLTGIQSDLSRVKTDAKSEFSSQVDAVEKASRALKTKVGAAKADPTAATLADVHSALSAFGTAADKLISDIESTC